MLPLLLPPTVSEELAWLADHGEAVKEREAARRFLRHRRTYEFELIRTIPLGDAYVETIADCLFHAALLPSTEASDAHLRAIDFQRLGFELASFDLIAPVIATSREIVRKFFR